MKIYLIQHGQAQAKEAGPDRALTPKGKEDSAKTAAFLKNAGVKAEIIFHSTKTRARETAEIMAEAISENVAVCQKEGLAPNDPAGEIIPEVLSAKKDVAIVGHLPFLQKFASIILLGSDKYEIINFCKAGVVCLCEDDDGNWKVEFNIMPDLLQ